jgi:VWFA-related protein
MRRWFVGTIVLLTAGSWQLRAGSWQPAAGSRELEAGSRELAAGSRQQQPAPPPQTIRSGTQVVQVDVRVHKDGKFVTDLGPGDFEIKEDGVPQKIESVVLIGGTSAPATPPAPAPSAPPAPLAPSAPPAIWVFIFDTNHLTPGGLTRTRDAVTKFINERFRQGDIGGVIADGRMANNRLTTDRPELSKAAAAVKVVGEARNLRAQMQEWPRVADEAEAFEIANGDAEALQTAVQRACQEDPPACRRAPPDLEIIEKSKDISATYKKATRLTLTVVEGLANGLARMPGTKTIVFLSEGFIVQEQEEELKQAVGQAARAGAHFYTIDARGLGAGRSADNLDRMQADSPITTARPRSDMALDGPNSLAVDTGGMAIRNENNFGRALDDIQKDAGTYYVVSYTASNTTFDGKYREIDVSVKRPGVKVRARKGYLALEPAALLRPTLTGAGGASAPRVSPKAEAPSIPTPDLPVSPGLIALPDATVPGSELTLVTNSASSNTPAVRSRIDGGKMVAELKSAGSKDPAYKSSEAELGWAAYERGDVVTAATHLAEAAKAPDARPWVHYALGLAQFARQRYKEAATAWERVLRDVPEFEPIYFSLADAYGLQRDEGGAIRVLRSAQQRWPNDPEVLDAIGVMQVKRGATDAAIESFEQATKVAPADALGYFNLGRALQMRLLSLQRYDPQLQKWVGGDADRKRATAAFEKYLEIGGPYQVQARDALAALAWR